MLWPLRFCVFLQSALTRTELSGDVSLPCGVWVRWVPSATVHWFFSKNYETVSTSWVSQTLGRLWRVLQVLQSDLSKTRRCNVLHLYILYSGDEIMRWNNGVFIINAEKAHTICEIRIQDETQKLSYTSLKTIKTWLIPWLRISIEIVRETFFEVWMIYQVPLFFERNYFILLLKFSSR